MKKGFTLLELLGVIVVLAIVMGLAIAAYLGLNGEIDVVYYHSLEESLKMAGADYFYYNKGLAPKIFGEQKDVIAKTLQENKYMQTEIKDKDGNSCNLEDSKVIAYKNKNGETEYHSCLICGEYKTTDNDPVCRGEVDYSLQARGRKETTNETYKLDGSSWSNKNIIVTFETANNINTVYVKGPGADKSCNLQEKGMVKTCEIKLETSGTYTYNFDEQSPGNEETFTIKIDKIAPTFTLDVSTNQQITPTTDSTTINNTIRNVTDNDSKIKLIEYSFEPDGESDYYRSVDLNGKDNNITVPISKTISAASYRLKVRAYDNAGNVSSVQEVLYEVFKKATPPSNGICRSGLKYTGSSQRLTTADSYTEYYFQDNYKTNAGTYTVYAQLNPGYKWTDGTTGAKSISCTIGKASSSISISPTSDSVVAGNSTSFRVSSSVSGSFSNSVYNSSIASISNSQSSYSETVYVTGKTSGSTTIYVYFYPYDSNYESKSGSYTIYVTSPPVVTPDPPKPVEPDPPKPSVKTVKYTVLHQKQTESGSYVTYEQETGTGTVGTTISPSTKNYSPNFSSPASQSLVLKESESSNVVTYKYARKCHGELCDYCDYGSPLGKCLYNKRTSISSLWESGLSADSSNQNVRYVNSPNNNYICIGVSSNTECSTQAVPHRMVGVFGTNHEVRVVRMKSFKSVWSNKQGSMYSTSTLRTNLTNKAKGFYGDGHLISGTSTKWADMFATETHGAFATGCTYSKSSPACSSSLTIRDAWKNTIDEMLTKEVNGTAFSYKYFPVSWSDLLLATGNASYSFKNNFSEIKNSSWLHDSSTHQFSYHTWNGNFTYVIAKSGRICSCNTSCNEGHETSSACPNQLFGAYYTEYYYRIYFNLSSSVPFCGGSGTSSDPIKVGYNTCQN